jgi:dTDP-4-dehydrorhamnose reductase
MLQDQPLYCLAGKRIGVAGHRGMVGSALLQRLKREDCILLTVDREDVDLTRQDAAEQWIGKAKPQAVLSRQLRWAAYSPMTAFRSNFYTTILHRRESTN